MRRSRLCMVNPKTPVGTSDGSARRRRSSRASWCHLRHANPRYLAKISVGMAVVKVTEVGLDRLAAHMEQYLCPPRTSACSL